MNCRCPEPIAIPSTRQEIKQASRAELVAYLEAWGFQCYDDETTRELRLAALDNYETETR